VARESWDFQDVHAFVEAAPKVAVQGLLFEGTPVRQIPVRVYGVRVGARGKRTVTENTLPPLASAAIDPPS
jgi:hypothetical protein